MNDIFAKDLSGEMVSPNEPGYDELITDIFDTMKTATEMNTGYHTPEVVHEYMGRILVRNWMQVPPFCHHSTSIMENP